MCWQCLYGDNCVCAKKKAQTNNKAKHKNVNCFREKTTEKKAINTLQNKALFCFENKQNERFNC